MKRYKTVNDTALTAVLSLAVGSAVLLGGCANTQSASLAKAQTVVADVKKEPGITGNEAAAEYLAKAEDALNDGEYQQALVTQFDAGADPKDVELYAHLAEKNALMAKSVAQASAQEVELAQLQQERDTALLAKQERESAERLAQQERDKREAELAAALGRAEEAGAEVQRGAGEIKVTFRNVTFDVNKAELKPEFETELKRIADALTNRYPNAQLAVKGHTDATGPDELNKALSEQRAVAVKTFLIGQGLQPARIASQGLGEAAPLASNDTQEGRAQNRRVELVISTEEIQ